VCGEEVYDRSGTNPATTLPCDQFPIHVHYSFHCLPSNNNNGSIHLHTSFYAPYVSFSFQRNNSYCVHCQEWNCNLFYRLIPSDLHKRILVTARWIWWLADGWMMGNHGAVIDVKYQVYCDWVYDMYISKSQMFITMCFTDDWFTFTFYCCTCSSHSRLYLTGALGPQPPVRSMSSPLSLYISPT
jgi:hypothetical protein